jgi:hypothetical protein
LAQYLEMPFKISLAYKQNQLTKVPTLDD